MAPGATIITKYGVYRAKPVGDGFKAFVETPPLPESPLHVDVRSLGECVMLIGLHINAHTGTVDKIAAALGATR